MRSKKLKVVKDGTAERSIAPPKIVRLGISAEEDICSENPSTPENAPMPCLSITFLIADIRSMFLVALKVVSAYSGKDFTTFIAPFIASVERLQIYLSGFNTMF